MGIGMLLVLVLIVALVFFLVRESGRNSGGGPGAQDALDHRFARGEIDEDEYRKRRDILKS